jgi:hypothetical protein
MPTKKELLAEAYSRGLLPPDKKAAYEEAMRRGLVPMLKKKMSPPVSSPQLSGGIEEVARQPMGVRELATGAMRSVFPKPKVDIPELPKLGLPSPEYVRAGLEVGGLTAGGIVGAASPVPGGAVLGAALMYAAGKKAADIYEGKKEFQFSGTTKVPVASEIEPYETELSVPIPELKGAREEAIKSARDIEEGLMIEAGGLAAGKFLSRAYNTKTAQKIEMTIRRNVAKALKPTVAKLKANRLIKRYTLQAREALGAIAANKNELEYDLGTVRGELPKNLSQLSEAIDQTKQMIFKEYDAIAGATGKEGARIMPTKAIEALREKLQDKAIIDAAPQTIQYIEGMIARLEKRAIAGGYTPLEAQKAITVWNQTTKELLQSTTIDSATRAVVDSEVNYHLKQQLFDVIESYGGAEYRELRQVYVGLRAIEEDVGRAVVRDMGRGAKGLIDFSDIFTSYVAVESILKYDPARFAAAGGARSVAAYYKYLNNPNTLVRQMFKDVEKLTIAPLKPVGRETLGKIVGKTQVDKRKKKPIPSAVMKKTPEEMPF